MSLILHNTYNLIDEITNTRRKKRINQKRGDKKNLTNLAFSL